MAKRYSKKSSKRHSKRRGGSKKRRSVSPARTSRKALVRKIKSTCKRTSYHRKGLGSRKKTSLAVTLRHCPRK